MHESAAAYEAFTAYRELGPSRTTTAAARALGKSPSLLYRWASRFAWRARAYAWDVTRDREQAAALAEQRQAILQRQLRDADRLQRLGMAALTNLVHRDRQTGELTLDQAVTPQAAVQICRLALDILRAFQPASEPSPAEEDTTEATLHGSSDAELRELIRLARERAQSDGQEDNPNASQPESQSRPETDGQANGA